MRLLKYLLLTLLIPGVASADLQQFIASRLISPNAKTSPVILGTTNSLDADWTIVAPTLMYTVDSGLSTPAIAIGKFGADSYAQQLQFYKTRSASATMDANTVVANGDALGTIRWSGADGASYREAAAIIARISASPGASDMPTDIEFWTTPDGAFSATQKWTVTQAGNLLQDSSGGGSLTMSRLGASSTGQMAMFGGGTTSYNVDITGTQYPTVLISQSPAAGSLDWSGIVGRGTTANGPQFRFLKTRSTSATLDANTVVNNGDQLGVIPFYGSDGTNYVIGGQIIAAVDASPGTNDLPTSLDFQVSPDGSATPASALKISNDKSMTAQGDFIFGQTNGYIRTNTSDASDTGRIMIGHGTIASTRGAILSINGNENASSSGYALLQSGNVSGAALDLINQSSNGNIRMIVNGGADTALTIASTKAATFGNNIIMGAGILNVASNVEAVAGAGSTVSDAAALSASKSFHQITGANGTVGWKFPSATAGDVHYLLSTTAGVPKVYAASGGTCNGGGADVACTLLSGITTHICYATAANTWICA